MSIASPSSEFIYDEYVEGRGVKMTNGKVEMPKQAYLKEHHNLIKLLKETSQKLTREADEQQAEIRGKGIFVMKFNINLTAYSLKASPGPKAQGPQEHPKVISALPSLQYLRIYPTESYE